MKRPLLSLGFTVEATSMREQQFVMSRLVFVLERGGYLIKAKTADTVYFKDDTWSIRRRSIFFKNADSGVFVIAPLHDGVGIKYTYYISCLTEAILMAFFLLVMFVTSPFILLFVFGLLVQLTVRIYTLEGAAQNLIDYITITE